jgi:CxxC motif-containing protein
VDIFFRVTGIYKATENAHLAIEVQSGDDVIASFKREHLAPGEMEKITLPKALLLKASAEAGITVRVNGKAEKLTGETPLYRTEHPDGTIEIICITCPKGCHLKVDSAHDFEVSGHSCERGEQYGRQEVRNPMRTVTSTVRMKTAVDSEMQQSRLPVKTDGSIPKAKIADAMRLLDEVELTPPVTSGDVVAVGYGITFVAASNFLSSPLNHRLR